MIATILMPLLSLSGVNFGAGPRSNTRSTIMPSTAASADAASTPILASSITSPRNARSVMNSDTVKPMPPSTATPATWRRPHAVGERAEPSAHARASTRRGCRRTCPPPARRRCRSSPGSTARGRSRRRSAPRPRWRGRRSARSRSSTAGAARPRAVRAPGTPRRGRAGVSSPSTTPASVGSTPASWRHHHSTTPGIDVRERMVDPQARHHDDEQRDARARRASHQPSSPRE